MDSRPFLKRTEDLGPESEDEANPSTAEGSTGGMNSLLSLGQCSSVPRDPGLCCYNFVAPFSSDDIAIQILTRTSTYSLLAFKCAAKRWNKLISDPSFLCIHYKRAYDTVGLFVQAVGRGGRNFSPLDKLHFVSFVDNKCRWNLDFLPEKVVLVCSSNGIICCRTYPVLPPGEFITREPVELVIYLCDLNRKEWITIGPPGSLCCNDMVLFGLAYYPFGTSSNPAPSFKLVNVQHRRNDPSLHSFFIYSSDTRKWKKSNAVFSYGSRIREDMARFVNGRLHWATLDHHILTFDVETESSELINLPCIEPRVNWGRTCFGESEGYLHYVCILARELQVWVLKDYDEPAWELKHCLDLLEFYSQNAGLFDAKFLNTLVDYSFKRPAQDANIFVNGWTYYNEVLDLLFFDVAVSYDFKTGRAIKYDGRFQEAHEMFFFPSVVQCQVNLVPLENFVGDGVHKSCQKER